MNQLVCYECGKPFGIHDDIHTNSRGEDVCELCCNLCSDEEKEQFNLALCSYEWVFWPTVDEGLD